MTEKFILTGDVQNGEQYKITDTELNYKYRNNKKDKQKICDMLNAFHEENQRLEKEKLDLSIYNQENEISALKEINKFKKENEQLKEENKQLQSKLEQYERIMSDFDVSSFDELRTIMEQGCGV